MLKTTMGQLLVNDALPDDLVDFNRTLDKKEMLNLLNQVATKHPEKYREISKRLADIGRIAATRNGGNSFGLAHLKRPAVGEQYRQKVTADLQKILNDERYASNPQRRREDIIKAVGSGRPELVKQVYQAALASGNPLANQILSGARGNPMNLADLHVGSGLYADSRGRTLPIPVLSSYSEGLRPMEYWAGTHGARKGVLAVKFAVQDAGFLSKQLNQAAHRVMVVGEEDDKESEYLRGMPVDTADPHNAGALLAHEVGPYRRNTPLTPKILAHLQRLKKDRILVRSPIVGGSPDGGVYARDAGVREFGRLPGRGEMIGLVASQGLSEPIAQGTLGAKHTGGVAGEDKAVGGFDAIDQTIQIPEHFKGGAAHADIDGRVERVDKAPAGGTYVWIGGKQHYVGPDFNLKVKPGDEVEAGDAISEGLVNPGRAVAHKHIGEGRRYFTDAFMNAMQEAGLKPHRRNVELLARGLVNHVRMTDEHMGHLPDEVVHYSALEHAWEPREGNKKLPVGPGLVGKYLEAPVLHYTIGTKVRPSTLKTLKEFGVKTVLTHHEPPPFEPEMQRGMYALQHDEDWMVRQYGSGLKGGFTDAVHKGLKSDEASTSFVPGLARGVDFGKVGPIQVPQPGTPLPPEGQPFEDPEMAKKKKEKPNPGLLKLPEPPSAPRSFFSLGSLFKQSSLQLEQMAEAQQLRARAMALVKSAEPRGAGVGPSLGVTNAGQPQIRPVSPVPGAPVGGGGPQPAPHPQAGPQHAPAPPAPAPHPAPHIQPQQGPGHPQGPQFSTPGHQVAAPQGQANSTRQQMAGFAMPYANSNPSWLGNMDAASAYVQQGDPEDLYGRTTRLSSLFSPEGASALTEGTPQRAPTSQTPWDQHMGHQPTEEAGASMPQGPQVPSLPPRNLADDVNGMGLHTMLGLPVPLQAAIENVLEMTGTATDAARGGSSALVARGNRQTDDVNRNVMAPFTSNYGTAGGWWNAAKGIFETGTQPLRVFQNGGIIGGALQDPGRGSEIRRDAQAQIEQGIGQDSLSENQRNPAPGSVRNRDTRQMRDQYALSPTANTPASPLQPAVANRFQQFLNGERVSTLEHAGGRESWTDPVTGTVVTQGMMDAYQAQQRARPSADPRAATSTGGADMRNDSATELDRLTGNSALQRLREQHPGEWRFDTGFGADLAVAARTAIYGPHMWAGGQIAEVNRAEGARRAAAANQQTQNRTFQQTRAQQMGQMPQILERMRNAYRVSDTSHIQLGEDGWTDPQTGTQVTRGTMADYESYRQQQANLARIAQERAALQRRVAERQWTIGPKW